ncbi:MAG: hypothetical protein ACOCP4_03845 [Candidatus Woesearchaeota archaeon]|uniref:Uncharacterized protein n=1 Tax=Arfiviricetes sp. TaxID=2832556 RepID=A0AB39A3B4_9VIRU
MISLIDLIIRVLSFGSIKSFEYVDGSFKFDTTISQEYITIVFAGCFFLWFVIIKIWKEFF